LVGDAEVVLATTGGDVVCFELSAVLDGVVVEAVAPRTRWLFSSRVPIFGSPCWLDGDTGDSSSGGRRVCITGATGLVLALRCADGTVSWRLELGTPVFSSPCALPGGLVVIGAHDKFARALWAQDGTLAWRHGMSDVVYSSAVVCACGGAAAVLVCSADGSIEMLSATGAQLHRLGRLPGQVRARACAAARWRVTCVPCVPLNRAASGVLDAHRGFRVRTARVPRRQAVRNPAAAVVVAGVCMHCVRRSRVSPRDKMQNSCRIARDGVKRSTRANRQKMPQARRVRACPRTRREKHTQGLYTIHARHLLPPPLRRSRRPPRPRGRRARRHASKIRVCLRGGRHVGRRGTLCTRVIVG
jgi:hypothetical protein